MNPSIDISNVSIGKAGLPDLIRKEAGLVSLLAMEILIFIPWFRAHLPGIRDQETAPVYFHLIGFSLLVMYLSRSIQANRGLSSYSRTIQIAMLAGGIYGFSGRYLFAGVDVSVGQLISRLLASFTLGAGGIPPSILLLTCVIYLWWRGISSAASESLEFFVVRRKFRAGILILGLYGAVHRLQEGFFLIEALPHFFLSGLFAVTISRTHRLSVRRAAFRLPFTGRWLLGISLIMLFTIVLGSMGGILLQTGVAKQIAEFLAGLLLRGFQTFVVVISPLFIWIIPVAERLAQMLMQQDQLELLPSDAEDPLFGDQDFSLDAFGEQHRIPQEVVIGMVILAFVLLIFLLVRTVRRQLRPEMPDYGDAGENTFDPHTIRQGLQGIWDRAMEGLEATRRFGVSRRMLAATVIRRVYLQFLNFAEDIGTPRHAWETPFEFQRRMSMMFPEEKEEIELITEAYTQVRYGEFPEEEEIVSKVKKAWELIRNAA